MIFKNLLLVHPFSASEQTIPLWWGVGSGDDMGRAKKQRLKWEFHKWLPLSRSSMSHGMCLPPWDSRVEVLTPRRPQKLTLFGDRVFKEDSKAKWGHGVGPNPIWLCPCMKRESRQGAGAQRKDHVKAQGPRGHLQATGRAMRRSQTCHDLDLGLQSPELWENKFLLFKPQSVVLG